MTIAKGDRLRVHPKSGFEGIPCKVAKCQISGDGGNRHIIITTSSPIECNTGDDVFLIGKAEKSSSHNNNSGNDHQKNIIAKPPRFNLKSTYPAAKQIANSLSQAPSSSKSPSQSTNKSANINPSPLPHPKPILWFKADKLYWLDAISATPCEHLIFDADISELESLLDSPSIVKAWRSRISIALPPFIEEPKLAFWRGVVKKCLSSGISSFTISNIGHFPLVAGAETLTAGSQLYCLNRFAQRELADRGVGGFVFSHEDEYLNIRNSVDPVSASTQNSGSASTRKSTPTSTRQSTSAPAPKPAPAPMLASTPSSTPTPILGIFPIYSAPPLFVSRMKPAIDTGATAVDPHGNEFFVAAKNGLYYTLPRAPVCLFAKRKRLSESGIENFLIDVSFHGDPAGAGGDGGYGLVSELVRGFKDGVRAAGSGAFNFKAGLR
jgi:putative protease